MINYIAVSIGDNIYAGEYVNLSKEDSEEEIHIKQSNGSNIELCIPVTGLNYIITMDGKKYEEQTKIKKVLNRLLETN
ncbi:hypothetical protein [Anaerocolumna aminovalerica]|uniref:hypothetical protein n=1 Tax=Anaerocolumna aminovalerica TaxID=1527 RepID=UPI00248D00A3|nr:hypothetical protein [Anaerocolumna aminovalerica]